MGGELLRIRERSGLTRTELAQAAGIDIGTLAMCEEGQSITDAHAGAIAPHVGVHPDFIRHGDELVREALLGEKERGH